MIDLHCHILPGVDDGAESMADSVDMARLAVDDGIATIVATPHRNTWAYQAPRAEVEALLDDVRMACRGAGCAVELVLGGESFLVPDLAEQVRSDLALTINGGRYLLIEWPYGQYPVFGNQVIFELQLRGIVPIIAHAERYDVVQHDVHWLVPLIERGVVVQVTASTLLGDAGSSQRKLVETLLTENLTHVLASDSHSVKHRPPALRAASDRAAELIGPERARALVDDVPRQILDNQPIDLPAPIVRQPRSFWAFWRARN